MTETTTRPMRAPNGTAHATFLALQAQQTDDCILWPYATSGRGYGQIRHDGRIQPAHRLSCEMAHGPAPSIEAQAAHACRNRHCVNPRHLRWATPAENQGDRIKDGTSNRGTRNRWNKLTESDVWQIRFFARGGLRHSDVARHFGVSRRSVSDIAAGVTWGWVR